MERKLPQIIIAGTAFTIDKDTEVLRESNNPGNHISFRDLKDEGDYFTMLYDLNSKNVSSDMTIMDAKNDNLKSVTLPRELLSHAETITEDHARMLNELSKERDWGIWVVDEQLAKRLMGQLPRINIAEKEFIIDWRLKELRSANDPGVRIDLQKLDMNHDGTEYLALYDKNNKQILDHGQHVSNLTQDLAMIRIPYELKLDPVGVAREYGMDDTALLHRFPIQKDLKARIESLPTKQVNKPLKQDEDIKQSNKRKRGKRL